MVLLPTSAAEQPLILWRSVFCHELAHLVRRDHWSALWAELLIIIVPWQPLAWRARQRLAFLREQACDDWVLSVGGEPTDYAESLLQLVPQSSPVHALAAVSSRESLKRRLEHVLAGVRITPKVGRCWIVAASLFSLAAVAGVGFAQQGKRSPAPSPEPASNPEIAKEIQPPTPQASQSAAPPNPTAPAPPPGVIAVRGRVSLPNGQPAVGATVRAIKAEYRRSEGGAEEFRVLTALSTDSQGEFRGSVNIGSMKEPGVQVNLWATLPGYGLTPYHLAPAEKSGPIEISLVDEEPIRGRILDLQGQPVRDARVEIVRYFDTTTPWVEQWLASARRVTSGQTFFNFTREEPKPDRREPILRIKSAESVSDVLMPAVKTNAEGRFEIKGVGRDRLVDLAISGPRITTIEAGILTRPLRPIPFKYHEISGSQFDRVAPPSVAVEGVVADEETGKPVPGARIIPTAVERENGVLLNDPHIVALLSRTSDAQGNYRLQGLETGTTNYYKIVVPDLPYPPVENGSIPVSESLKPIRHDIKLRRGVWAIGRAFDRTNGKPVPGSVYYTPFRSNPAARNYERYRNPPTDFLANYPFGFVDGQGRFKIPVIPGRGVVCLKCSEGNYRPNLGRSEIKELAGSEKANPGRGPTYERLLSEPFHAVRAINVTPDTQETHVDLPVDPGQNVVLKFTDAGGSSLAGLETYGLRLDPHSRMNRSRSSIEGNSATLYASSPDETRTIWIKHRSSGLTKLLHFTPKVGETERTVVLEPAAVVTGRLVTPEGAPLADLRIECVFDSNSADRLPFVKTDAEGRFREELPAGGPFQLYCDPFPFAFFAEKLTVVAGEEVDFGQITIERDPKGLSRPKVHRGPEKRTKPPGIAKASNAAAPRPDVHLVSAVTEKKPTPQATTREIHGRVLLLNGQPAVGASVRAMTAAGWPRSWPEAKGNLLGTFSTNAEGRFEGKISAPLGTRPEWATRSGSGRRGISIPGVDVNLWATLPGYGVALVQLDSVEGNEQIVMNLAEEEPIRGHLIDLEGRPIRDARVEVLRFSDPTAAAIDQWLASLQGVKPEYRKNPGVPSKSIDWVPQGLLASVKANSDGRFELKGVGHDRNVTLRISAPQVTTILAYVLTRPMKPIQFKYFEIFGSQFERIVPPSVPIEGFVTDEETGKPIPRARIFPTAVWRDTVVQDFGAYVSATTDERGHYRLEGLETVTTNVVGVSVPDLPYPQANQIFVSPAKSLEPIRKDIKLRRGVWAAGRAYDRTTGKPVSGTISYTPFESNRFADKFDHQFNFSGKTEDVSGHFRVLVIPGRGVVCLQCSTGDYRFDFGKSEIKEFAPPKPSQRQTRTSNFLPSESYHSVRAIDVPPNAEDVHVDLPVDPGQNVVLKFTDAAGKPLAGIETYGLRFPDPRSLPGRGQSFVAGDSATLYATSPDESRPIWLRHRASGLTKQFKFTPKAGETARTIVLEPPAIVTGRVVSPDGAGISGIPIGAYGVLPGGPWPSDLMSDKDGRFRIEFPAGGPVSLRSQWTKLAGGLTFEAGERVDLGDITIERGNNRFDAKVHRGPEKRTKATGTAKASTVSAPPSMAHPTPKGSPSKPETPEIEELAPPSGRQIRTPVVPLFGRYHSLHATDLPLNAEEVRVDRSGFVTIAEKVAFAPGKTIDLGEIKLRP